MSALILAALLLVCFEVMWAHVPSLRPQRLHFRGMLALFWGTAALIAVGAAYEPLAGLYFRGVPRFASDAATYQDQAAVLADRFRAGALVGFFDNAYFNYSRLLALLYVVFGTDAAVGSVFNAVFYMASVTAVFYIGRLLFNVRVGVVAAWLCAIAPTFLLHDTQTLKWAATTAGLHVAVMGTLLLSNRRWPAGFLLAVFGFAVLVNDLPYIARLFMLVVATYAAMTFLCRSLGRERLIVGMRLAILAMTLVTWYRWSWPAPVVSTVDIRLQEVFIRRNAASQARPATLPPVQQGDAGPAAAASGALAARLDSVIAPALLARTGFLDEVRHLQRSGVNIGTAIEGEELATFGEFVRNVPAAVGVAVTEPTIPRLLSHSNSSSKLRKIAAVEMVFYYLITAMAFWGLVLAFQADSRTTILTAFVMLLIAGAYVLLGTTILNGGTLHRLRQPYVGFLCVFAAAGIIQIRDRYIRGVAP